ncbi:hypothetical protein [Streptomyces sp. NPDC048637]|uniref:hypothetical protein n=1 Tax=Streptomyces sp. NPDC048637 TaxID=3155636 RepID=UPI00342FC3A4
MIVVLACTVISLATAIVVMAFSGGPLATFGASGSAFIATLGAGMNVLSHVRRDA